MLEPPHKTEQYEYLIDVNLRLRVHLEIEANRTVKAAIALEHQGTDNKWRRVVCYDNWGGTWHRDRYKPNGNHWTRHEPDFTSDDTDLAIRWAQSELVTRAHEYVRDFREVDE